MARMLLVYATTHGHTAKIAARIAEVLRDEGVEVERCSFEDATAEAMAGADAIVVGAPVYRGHHNRDLVNWVKVHRAQLSTSAVSQGARRRCPPSMKQPREISIRGPAALVRVGPMWFAQAIRVDT